MKSTLPRRPASRSPQSPQNGFALVAVLLMMVLLTLVAIGLLSLSTVALRTSSHDSALLRARSNARLAMQLAIGRLQSLAGPDQRVTAPSSIRAEDRSGQSGLTGVWEGWKWNGEGSTPNWKKEKSDRFKGWLISSPDPEATLEEDFVKHQAGGETVELVAESSDQSAVKAPLVPVPGRASEKSKLAWAVFDESQKTSISLPHDEKRETLAGQYDRMGAASRPDYTAVTTRDWKILADRKTDVTKLLTPGQAKLIGLDEKSRGFHDITTGSLGLVTNVADGGFSGDLSRLFDRALLPDDFASRFLYSGTNTPRVEPPVRFAGANPMPSPDPSWALLHSYYRSYTKLTGGDLPMITTAVTPRPPAGTPSSETLRHASFNELQIAPVIAKAQFVFSLGFGYANSLQDMYDKGSAKASPPEEKDKYITWLVIDPVITLWNPYNVRLKFTGGRVDLYRVPLSFQIYKNGTLINSAPTSFANAYTAEDFKDRDEDRYYRLNVLPEEGKKELILEPGEHIVFTAQNHVKHYRHEYNTVGLNLRPGFHPPAGNDSDPHVGGVTTMNLFVDGNGKSSGKDYGKTVRTVAVKPGDEIQVAVQPFRSGVDSYKETNGKEATGFLRYYVGGTNVSRLVGGIELDYGKREKEFLPAFSREELPTIVVNSAIPPNAAADAYQGKLPPPAVRFKEPFLIATFQEKTERDSRFPSRSWLQNGTANFYSSGGIDQNEDFEHQQYEFRWEPMTDWPLSSPTIEISNEGNRGYGGSGVYAQSGTEFATFSTLPLAPAHSIAQLRHAPLNVGGQLPLTGQIVGNSFLPPLLGEALVKSEAEGRTYLDHSYLANNALFDSWFFSTAADHPALSGEKARTAKNLLKDFFVNDQPLPNRRFRAYAGGVAPGRLADRLESSDEAYREIGSHLLIEAPFNINSTRVAAWEALLASNFSAAVPVSEKGVLRLDEGKGLPVLRHPHAVVIEAGSGVGNVAADHAKWNGYRRLDEKQISRIAEEIVAEVKKRGPFQSVAEFVNRRPGSGELARSGAVEAAIERAGINLGVLDTAHGLPVSGGNTADGAPGIINQADLLTPLAPQLVARGDTFRIRAYGESGSSRAWLEATVQRLPEFVDPTDKPTATPASLANQTFGRRFELISFRWLKPEEI